jgi:tetratricopeptide (TPR) repeat protein
MAAATDVVHGGRWGDMLAGYSRRLVERLRRACPPAVRANLSRVLRLRTSVAFRLFARAQVLASAREYQKAISTARMALRFQPRFVPAYEILIQLLAHVGAYDKALGVCARAMEVNARSDGVIASVRNILPQVRRSGHPEKVIRTLDRCLAAFPYQIDVLKTLVGMLSELGRYREAVLACDRLLEIDPDLMAVVQTREQIFDDPKARPQLHGLQAAKIQRPDEYERLVAHNVAGQLADVMTRFYRDMGADVSSVPLIRALNNFRQGLSRGHAASSQPASSPLIQFERAWANYQEGHTSEAFRLFETVFGDASARMRIDGNPFIREAVVRSGEMLGRYQETAGNIDAAVAIYRQILQLDGDGVIARRLLLLLSRRGNLREAANFAETAFVNRINLYPQLLDNPYIADLKKEMASSS